MEALEEIMIKREDGIRLMPEMYTVPGDKVSQNTYSKGIKGIKLMLLHYKCVPTTIILYVFFFLFFSLCVLSCFSL